MNSPTEEPRSGAPPLTIAIDGPAASGKSTIGYYLARWLDYLYLDTGVLYRAVTWAALAREVPIEDEERITELAETLTIVVTPPTVNDGRQYTVRIENQDVTWELRTPAVDQAVSPVSAYPGVRAALTRQMRRIGARGRVVMVGRDIGTVVLPDAELKLYVQASIEERARRRMLDRHTQGKETSYDEMLAELQRRDKIDSHREAAPLRAASDALHFDNTQLSIEQMLTEIEQLILAEQVCPRN